MSRAGFLPRPGRRQVLLWLAALPAVGAVMLSATSSYLIRTATALAAAYVLVRAARRHRDGLGRARGFFAAALLAGAVSGVVAAGYYLVAGEAPPTGFVSDWIYLSYAPLAILGLVTVPRSGGARGGTVRALADGAVAAGGLLYLTLVLLIDPRGLGENLEPAARAVTLAYPLAPACVVAVILSVLPRAAREARPFLIRAALGISMLGLSDAAFAVVSWNGVYEPTSWIAAANQVGLLLILDAALVGATRVRTEPDSSTDADLAATQGVLVLAAPYAPLLVAVAAAVRELVEGRGVANSQLGALLLIGFAVVVRHVASTRETSHLVARITERERAARSQARTDPLTGMANRSAFVEQLDAALRDPACHPVAVALLDLNDFKDINDTHGHDTGDEVLRQTADRLRHAVPYGGVARLGGDEFAAFVASAHDDGRLLAQEIADAFRESMRVGHRYFQIRPSVGVVLDERPPGAARPGDASHLLAHADVAMYQAKTAKAHQDVPITILTGQARSSAAATIRIRDEISTPDLDQFHVVYQPIVDLQNGTIVSAEALLRWTHPGFGPISPETFIPLAERVGSVSALGEHVLGVALDDVVRWSAAAGQPVAVSVNISPRQLGDPALAETVLGMVAARGLGPQQLALEVTEEALVDDIEPVVETIAALRRGGLSVSVDDFGTGYSSLRYLRRFDANILKIDREFVQASSTEPRTEALIRSVVSMAEALGLACVAEGIETLEQLSIVRANGCRFGQGFLLARPMDADALEQLLVEGHEYPVEVQTPRSGTTAVVALRGVN